MDDKLTTAELAALKLEIKDVLNQTLIKLEKVGTRYDYAERGLWDNDDNKWIITKPEMPDGIFLACLKNYLSTVLTNEIEASYYEDNAYYNSNC